MPDHRYYVLVEWGKRQMANNSAASWDPDDGSGTFGSVLLCPRTVSNPTPVDVTHTACNTIAPEEWRSGILTAYDNIPFMEVYRIRTPYPTSSMVEVYGGGVWSGLVEERLERVVLVHQGLQRIFPGTDQSDGQEGTF